MVKNKKPIQFLEYRGFTIKFRLLGELDKKKSRNDLKQLNVKGKELSKHPHHIIPNTKKRKEYFAMRSDINNGILLCSYCHQTGPNSAHKNSLYFVHWLQKNRNEQYLYLLSQLILLNRELA